MTFSGYVLNGSRNKELDFGSDLDHCVDHLDTRLLEVCAD